MKARILCIYEEGSITNTSLIGAEGLSIMIDVDEQRTLFDTGRKGKYLLHNLDWLEIPPESFSRVVISHAHKDHIGGLDDFLEARETPITVVAHKDLNIEETEEASKLKKESAEGWTRLSEHLFTIEFPAVECKGFFGNETIKETALVLMSRSGPVLITGCAHIGLIDAIDIVMKATGKEVYAVVGGVHLIKKKNPELDAIAAYLTKEVKTPQLYLNHCAVPKAKNQLRRRLGLKGVKEFYVGNEFILDV